MLDPRNRRIAQFGKKIGGDGGNRSSNTVTRLLQGLKAFLRFRSTADCLLVRSFFFSKGSLIINSGPGETQNALIACSNSINICTPIRQRPRGLFKLPYLSLPTGPCGGPLRMCGLRIFRKFQCLVSRCSRHDTLREHLAFTSERFVLGQKTTYQPIFLFDLT